MKSLTWRRPFKLAWQTRRQTVASLMLPVYFLSTLPPSAWAQTTSPSLPAVVLTPKNVKVNTHRAEGRGYAGVRLPSQPSNSALTLSHAYAEPLVPVGPKTTPSENEALASATKKFLARKQDEDVSALTGFLATYPDSAWRASLDLNLAEVYYKTGYFSEALDAWQDAWNRTQDVKDATGQKVADLAVAKLAKMKARIGRSDELNALFQQIKGRSITGQAAQLLVEARSGLWLMQKHPERAFRCGPSALQEVSFAMRHRVDHADLIKNSRSTPNGIILSDVAALSNKIGMPMQMAKRSPGARFIVPAVIHWKLNHYAALIGKRDGGYEVRDTTFGKSKFLISAKALEQGTDGYFLVPKGNLPSGWNVVDQSEGSQVFGRGDTICEDGDSFGEDAPPADPNPNGTGNNGPGTPGGDCGSSGNGSGGAGPWAGGDAADYDSDSSVAMTEATVKAMLVSLNLSDTPLRYTPPVGPHMLFTVQYNQRDNTQPTTFTYSNLGPGWTFSYLSYITPGSSTSTVYERGGGVETFYYNSDTSSWNPSQMTQEVLSQVNSTTWQRAFANGEIETYGQPDGSGRFFLTQITDPNGNCLNLTYDANFRLTSLTDAIGQVTTLSYASEVSTDLPAFFEITKVTDPFGRMAQFGYNSAGQLQQITDLIGITSSFTYAAHNFVASLTTPYGITNFSYADISTDPSLGTTRWMEVTYPDGNKTRTEYNENETPGGVTGEGDNAGIPANMYPGVGAYNTFMEYRNTYFWDKQAMKDHAGDYTQAKVTHWLHTSDINVTSDIEESHKSVDQNRIWFAYAGEISSYQASDTMIAEPTQAGRIMDDGSTQLFTYAYNALGKVTQKIDPLGRETDYAYAANDIDLLTVKQKNGSGYDLLATYTYNGQHEVLTATDASGQTTTNTYCSNGKLHTATNAKNQTTTYAYDSNGYLTSVTGPATGATITFTYDGYGRVDTITDSQGYTTTTNYDAMDRPTLVTYPDGTTSQMNYSNLDLQYIKDRLGRWTHTFYNSLRQPTAVMDAMEHVTTSNWTLSAGLQAIIDANGNSTTWKYDNQNRITEKDYPDGTKQQIAYETTTSRVKSVTDAKGQVATTTYNLDNTVAQAVYSNTSVATPTVSYTYDSIYPRVSTMTDGSGTTTYSYNAVSGTVGSNMLGSMTTPLTTIGYTYDELGRQLSQTIGGVSSSVTYDTLGRISTATNALSATAFTYSYLNNTGRVSSIAYPNGQQVQYTYQDSSTTPNEPRLSEIKNLNASSAVISKFDYGYDSQGQITSWTQQADSNDPQNYGLQYDKAGRLINGTVTDTTTSALVHQYAYSYDAAGNRSAEQIDGNVTSASFNSLNQLTGTSAGGQMIFSGTVSKYATVTVGGSPASLDANNNFRGTTSVTTGTNDVPVVATDVDGNISTNNYQVVVPPGGSGSYTYDDDGNLTQDATRSYQWDAKNELTAIIYNAGPNAGNHTEFTYNGAGERVKIVEATGTTAGSGTATSTKQYVWAGGIAEERDGDGNVTKRYFGQGEQRIVSGTATNYFYTRDHIGSVREMIAGDGGTIAARYTYDPFGRTNQVSGSISCDFEYAGMYQHAISGLNLTMYRVYDPNLGRWISRDPSGEGSGLNLYCYCNDNSICETDFLGLDAHGTADIDYDGDPHAYAPPGSGLKGDDYLSNATRKNGSLSSNVIVFSHGSPVTNSDGYYESKTSLQINGQYVNGQAVSYVALGTQQAEGIPLGTVMTLTDTTTGATTTAIYADSRGGNNTDVEMSPQAARDLGLPFNKHGVDSNDNITAVPAVPPSPTTNAGTGQACVDSPPAPTID